MHIRGLLEGRTVQFRPRGSSMQPQIKSGQLCTVSPVAIAEVAVGDVVLCTVRGRQYLHKALALRGDGQVQIGNNRGGVNGWTRRVYGRLVSVE